MMSPEELLRANGIVLKSYAPGRYYAPCPRCSPGRKLGHQKLKCLGVTIDGDRVHWGCNHCGWTGPQKGVGNGGGAPDRCHLYGETLRKIKNPPGRKQRFIWQHLNGKGEWENGTGGAKTATMLYRVDELHEAMAAGETIAVVEGEKDADNLWRIGIPATCNAHGASEPGKAPKWYRAHSEQLRGADLVVLNDNDAPGNAHAETIVACSLGLAKQVRRLDLTEHWPDIGAGDDVSDWLARGGGTPEALRELIAAAPVIAGISNDDSEHEQILAELNRDNAVVLDGGKAWVLRFDQVSHKVSGYRYSYSVPIYLRKADFLTLYMNRRVKIDQERSMELGQWWLKHLARRQYFGLVFEPGGKEVIEGKLNLWTGWGVEPKRGDWSLMREHIFEVLAAGDEAVDAYVIKWLAWAVQHPDQQAETAPTFLGKRGTGRGTLGNAMCRIFGNHALHISSPHHLVGRFNAHLRQCAFLFADEAFVVDDRAAEGKLKALITEDTIPLEGKGKDVITVPNHLHAMIASNEDWVVPAGEFERRFVVQNVADNHIQEEAWFKPLYEQLHNGGLQAMLFDLLHYDLGDWHPRKIVRTAALAAQQAESLSPFDAWWEDILHDGYLPAGDADGKVISGDYIVRVFDGYNNDQSGRYRREKRKGLFEQARTSSPGLKRREDAAFGRYLVKRGCVSKRICRQRGWQFPPLDHCRTEWLTRFPDTVWNKPDATAWQGERDDDDD